jgi:hypothetical protein
MLSNSTTRDECTGGQYSHSLTSIRKLPLSPFFTPFAPSFSFRGMYGICPETYTVHKYCCCEESCLVAPLASDANRRFALLGTTAAGKVPKD